MSCDSIEKCAYILPKKKRQCKLNVRKGSRFCGEHSIFNATTTRVRCPLDPKHTVDRHELDDHLAKCNERLTNDPWIVANINRCTDADLIAEEDVHMRKFNALNVVDKYVKFHELYQRLAKMATKVEDDILEHTFLVNAINDSSTSGSVKKHLIQQSSMLQQLENGGLLDSSKQCIKYIEFGAGKGQLTYQICQVADASRSSFLVIDRAGSRVKFDNKARRQMANIDLMRIRCSIENLQLSNLSSFDEQDCKRVALCKHLCGNATDYALNAMRTYQLNGGRIDAMMLAPCCHHKCTWADYTARDFLEAQHVSIVEWPALRHAASWAVCGFEKCNNDNRHCDNNQTCPVCTFTTEMKIDFGHKAKALLELGRKKFIESLGFDVKIKRYVTNDVTPENIILVARMK